jgi:hypothetical protein
MFSASEECTIYIGQQFPANPAQQRHDCGAQQHRSKRPLSDSISHAERSKGRIFDQIWAQVDSVKLPV